MNIVRFFNVKEMSLELTLSSIACTGTVAIPSFGERHMTFIFRGFVALTGKPWIQRGFALLVLRVIEGELSAWKLAQSLCLIGGFNKLFSSSLL